jgi:hypothetical protein
LVVPVATPPAHVVEPQPQAQPLEPVLHKNVAPDHTQSLAELQHKGFGGNVTFKTQGGVGAPSQPVSSQDGKQLEQALQSTKADEVMKEPVKEPVAHQPTELKLQRGPTMPPLEGVAAAEPAEPNLDEIYIDVRGQLHHRTEDEEAAEQPKHPTQAN